jgi:hypothetical protein
MKAEVHKPGILSRAAAALTHNWGLKILALLLAILVYYSLKTERPQIPGVPANGMAVSQGEGTAGNGKK